MLEPISQWTPVMTESLIVVWLWGAVPSQITTLLLMRVIQLSADMAFKALG